MSDTLAYAIGTAAKGGKVHLAVEKTPGNFMILCRFNSRWGATPLTHPMEVLAGEGNDVMFAAFSRHNLTPGKLCRNCFYGRTIADYERFLRAPAPIVAPVREPEPLREGSKDYRIISASGGVHAYEVGGNGRCLVCQPICRKKDGAPVRREFTVAAQSSAQAVDLTSLRWNPPTPNLRGTFDHLWSALGRQMAPVRHAVAEEVKKDAVAGEKLAKLKARWDELAAGPEGIDPERLKAAMDAGTIRADRTMPTLDAALSDVARSLRWYEVAMAGADLAYRTGMFERVATMPLS